MTKVLQEASPKSDDSRVSSGNRSSIPGKGEIFLSKPELPDRLWGQTSLLWNGYRGPYPGVKWPGREAYHLSPTAGVKKE